MKKLLTRKTASSRSMEEEKLASLALIAALLAFSLGWSVLGWVLVAKAIWDTLCSWAAGIMEVISNSKFFLKVKADLDKADQPGSDKDRYHLFCSDGDYLKDVTREAISDEIDTRMFLLNGMMVVVNAKLSAEEVQDALATFPSMIHDLCL